MPIPAQDIAGDSNHRLKHPWCGWHRSMLAGGTWTSRLQFSLIRRTSSSKSAPGSVSFWWFHGETNFIEVKSSSHKKFLRVLPTSSSKVLRSRQFLVCWSTNELSPLSCALFPEPRKHRPYFRDPSNHFTQRNAQCFHQWIHSHASEPLHVPSGWHDDMVDMVVEILTTTIVRNSEVFEPNSLDKRDFS